MSGPIAPGKRCAKRLTAALGWCAALALLAAVGRAAYRRQIGPEGLIERPPRWADLLFLGGALGQAAYGRSRRDRVATASGLGMVLGQAAGLALSPEPREFGAAPRPPEGEALAGPLRPFASRSLASAIRAGNPAVGAGALGDDQPEGNSPMNSSNPDEKGNARPDHEDSGQGHDPGQVEDPAEAWKPVAGPEVIETSDPAITWGPRQTAAWKNQPDSTVVVETSRISEPAAPHASGIVIVPYEERPSQGRERDRNKDRDDSKDDHERPSDEETGRSEPRSREHSDPSTSSKTQGKPRETGPRDSDRKDDPRHHDRSGDEDRHDSRPAAPSMTRVLLFSGLVALVCGVAGAWGYSYFFAGKGKSDDQKQAQSSGGGKGAGGGSEKGAGGASKPSKGSDEEQAGSASNEADTIPGFTTAEDADSLRKQIGHLTERLDALQNRLDQLRGPRDQTPPDLHTLQIKMGELSRTIDDVANLPARVHRLGSRLEELQQQLKMVRDRESARENQETDRPIVVVDKTPSMVAPSEPAPPGTAAPTPPSTPAPPYTSSDAPDAALEQAIELFKLGQYTLAANILAGLRRTQPDDARVWYFSALVNGLTTADWDNKTREFAERGASRERAGTPTRAVVDRALSGVTRTQGLDWLEALRSRKPGQALPKS